MVRYLIILAVLAAVFWVFSIVDCALQPPTRHRGVGKRTWVALVVILPVVGGLLWFLIGRSKRGTNARRSMAPDDDPEFLGSLGARAAEDERIRRLEEDLRRLDEEPDADEPPSGR